MESLLHDKIEGFITNMASAWVMDHWWYIVAAIASLLGTVITVSALTSAMKKYIPVLALAACVFVAVAFIGRPQVEQSVDPVPVNTVQIDAVLSRLEQMQQTLEGEKSARLSAEERITAAQKQLQTAQQEASSMRGEIEQAAADRRQAAEDLKKVEDARALQRQLREAQARNAKVEQEAQAKMAALEAKIPKNKTMIRLVGGEFNTPNAKCEYCSAMLVIGEIKEYESSYPKNVTCPRCKESISPSGARNLWRDQQEGMQNRRIR